MPPPGYRAILSGMKSVELKFGLPDLELSCSADRKINPASFAGHDLIVLFSPIDASDQEIAAYRHHCDEFVKRDAWLLAFADECDLHVSGQERVLTIADPERRAWTAFRDLTSHAEELDRGDGATFLFTRGGSLHRYWHGRGHVQDVLAELRKPSAEHEHQLAR